MSAPPPHAASIGPTRPAEPTPARLPKRWQRYLVAIRPAFLLITVVGVALGCASAALDGHTPAVGRAFVTLLLAALAHAAANLLNDYYDALSGCDAANSARIYPYSGGSRVIQNRVLTTGQVARAGYLVLLLVIAGGLWLASQSGHGLVALGLSGVLLAWAYSAPPGRLQSRGLGELTIASAWLLVVVGSDYVQRGAFDFTPIAAGTSFAVLVANILYLNQFPDRAADAQAGKRTLVVRLGSQTARWGALVLTMTAYGWLLAMVASARLPVRALWALAPAAAHLWAALILLRLHDQPSQLAPALRLTIFATMLHGVLLTLLLFGSA